MRIRLISLVIATALVGVGVGLSAGRPPNVVFILADDLGYGDVHCLNPQRGKIPTPSIDRLAAQGMVFTDAHSTSAVCTPTRYSNLTSRYNWRSKLQRGVLSPLAPPLIAELRLTLPALLRQHGYRTACIGKWHLGWDWPEPGKILSSPDSRMEPPNRQDGAPASSPALVERKSMCPDSGGFRKLSAVEVARQELPQVQLYDLSVDIGETRNLSECQPDIGERPAELLASAVAEGRTPPGPARPTMWT